LPRSIYQQEALTTGRLAGPIVIGQLAQMATGFTDTVMAGRISPLDLGAIAVGTNLWILPFLFCLGLLMAISSMVSHYYGANRYGAIKDLMRQALGLSLLLAIICVIAARGLTGLLHLLQLDADITRVASDYVKAVSWGLPAVIGYLALRFLSEGIGYTKPMMLIQLAGLVFNALLNYILMFGKLGMPAMGAVGAGWATAIVMWLNLIFLLLYIATHRRFQTIWQSKAEPGNWSRIFEVIRLGLPIAVALTAEVSLFAAVSLLMGKIGVLEVAAHQVAINFASIAFMIPLGIGAATTIRVGHAMGEGRQELARFRGLTGISLAIACTMLTASVMLLLPETIVAIYTDDAEVRTLAISLLFMAAIFQLSDGIQIAANGALRGMKDTFHPMLITLVVYWLFGLPLSWYLGFTRGFGPQGLWMGLVASLTLAAVWLVWRFLHLSRFLAASQAQEAVRE
jgi:MATE family multidrug resistance protein